MAAARRHYTKEFKEQAVGLITEQGISLAQATRDLGLRESLLRRTCMRGGGGPVPPLLYLWQARAHAAASGPGAVWSYEIWSYDGLS